MIMASSPYSNQPDTVSKVMLAVMYALIPGALVMIYFFGWGVAINLAIAISTALVAEAIVLKLRNRPVKPFISDGSAALTAILLALALPTLAPWWLVFLGALFAIVIAKQLYGGLGYNPFNPAMAGYVMLMVAFPQEMTAWINPLEHALSAADFFNYSFFGELPAGKSYDAVTMATVLDTVKTNLGMNITLDEIKVQQESLFGGLAGTGWEWINLMFLLGGLLLLFMRVISWHIPLAFLASLFFIAAFFNGVDSDFYPGPLFHLFSGGAMLAAFFIATDPVTAATTNKGKLLYGIGIGALTYIIRTWGGYPDGVAFAVLIMNMAVPTIDYYTQPRVFGQEKD
jgi:electron transport complex protein RnfD